MISIKFSALIFIYDKKDIKFLKAFGIQIRKLRNEKNLTQEKLAERSDLEDADIRRIESGKLNTGLTRIKALADGLEVNVKELFDFD